MTIEQKAGLIFLGVPMLMYLLQGATVYYAVGRYGMTLCVVAYAIANIGLILDLFGI
jgi:hypothetical protein